MFSRYRQLFRNWRFNRRGFLNWHGGPLYFPPNSSVAMCLLNSGNWEPDVSLMLTTAARPNTVVFDVGANIGASAVTIMHQHHDVRVISFEPSPKVLSHLIRSREASQYRARWEIVPKAVTERSGQEITFNVHVGCGGDVYDGLRDTGRSVVKAAEVKVPTVSIDTEWQSRGRPNISLIKVDVEGAEMGVLAGATECLATCRPIVITEWCSKNFVVYGHQPEDIFQAADAAGYDVFVIPELYPIHLDVRALPFQLAGHENLLLLPKP